MALRKLKPTTPGQRGASVPDFAELTRTTPEKSLVRPIHSKGGRNAYEVAVSNMTKVVKSVTSERGPLLRLRAERSFQKCQHALQR